MCGTSLAVSTATTPGTRSAALVVDREDARVRAMRKDDFQAQMLVADEIGRIFRGAGHLPERVGARQRLADHTRASAFAASLASIIASRILR